MLPLKLSSLCLAEILPPGDGRCFWSLLLFNNVRQAFAALSKYDRMPRAKVTVLAAFCDISNWSSFFLKSGYQKLQYSINSSLKLFTVTRIYFLFQFLYMKDGIFCDWTAWWVYVELVSHNDHKLLWVTAFQGHPMFFLSDLRFLSLDVWAGNEVILGCCLFQVELTLSVIRVNSLRLVWPRVCLPSAVLSETFISDAISVTNFLPQLLIEFGQHWIKTMPWKCL